MRFFMRGRCPLFFVLVTGQVFLSLVLSGCGSGGHDNGSPSPQATPSPQAAPGAVHLRVQWPSRTGRIVPLASESLVVVFEDASRHELARATALRSGDDASTSDVRFTAVPVGTYFAQAIAYPQADGSGVAQARAEFSLTVVSGTETTQDVSVQSAITSLSVASASALSLAPGQSLALFVSARDAGGAVVVTRPAQFAWQSSNPTVASVDAGGVVTGQAEGQAAITVRDTESGSTTQVAVAVVPGG